MKFTRYERAKWNRQKAKEILDEIVQESGYTVAELVGQSRQANVTAVRQEAMSRMREKTTLSLTEIGDFFGGRHHTTVINALKRKVA